MLTQDEIKQGVFNICAAARKRFMTDKKLRTMHGVCVGMSAEAIAKKEQLYVESALKSECDKPSSPLHRAPGVDHIAADVIEKFASK